METRGPARSPMHYLCSLGYLTPKLTYCETLAAAINNEQDKFHWKPRPPQYFSIAISRVSGNQHVVKNKHKLFYI